MERILLVDDEPQVLVALEDLLCDDFIVLKTESPLQALDVVANDQDIAVVVSDERMPAMPGSELLARLRNCSNARRILVTGFADLTGVLRAVNEGRIFAYVTKPWDGPDLRQKVRHAADQFRLVQDVTSEHQLLRDLMDNTPDGIYFKDKHLRVRGANKSYAHLLGADDEKALVGLTVEEVNSEFPHAHSDQEEDRSILSSGRRLLDVVRDYSSGGKRRWVSESKAPIVAAHREVVGIVGIARDVTERVLMQETLQESEARLSHKSQLLDTILNSMREAVIASNQAGELVLFNREARAMFGDLRSDVSAIEWAQSQEVLLSNGQRPESLDDNPLVGAMLGERTAETEVSIRGAHPEGAVLALSGTPLKAENNKVIGGLALLRDVTEQRLLERQLAQAQKMDAIGRLAGGVAHDFSNLLSVIISYADFIQQALPPGDHLREDLKEILEAANRAASLTRQLLTIGRHRVAHEEPLQLNDVVTNTERMLRRLLGANVVLTLKLSRSLAPVEADLGQLEQVLLNLAVNANDAMPSGGEIVIETCNVDLDVTKATAHGPIPPGAYVMLAVSDTGEGMDPDTTKRVFEPFFTTKGVGKGTGLGLATAYGIVQRSRGHIDLESELGKGTCFRIYLPRAGRADAREPRQASASAPRAREATVLLVEDDDAVRAVSSRILRARGHSVIAAKTPNEALALWRREQAVVDLLLTDFALPEMTGAELALLLSPSCPDLKVLLTSNYSHPKHSGDGLDLVADCIQKPFSPHALADKVQELLLADH